MDCSQNPLNIVKYQNDKEVPLDNLSHIVISSTYI
uniref:Uncharacterized protein n=1 Tax=Arundo donax TaxID=35708 RepID=A0A0A9FXI3_ARUDO